MLLISNLFIVAGIAMAEAIKLWEQRGRHGDQQMYAAHAAASAQRMYDTRYGGYGQQPGAYGDGYGYQQPPLGYPPQGYPQQGYPPQGYPQQQEGHHHHGRHHGHHHQGW